jgi:hypothetical protein
MRGVKIAVAVMSVLIVLGVAVIGLTIVRRLSGGNAVAAALVLQEPAGTRIGGIASAADRLAILLQGGGTDRVVLLDPRTGHITTRVLLAQ